MFRFEEPAYLYLLLLLPLLAAFYLYSNYRRRKNIRKFGDPELMAQLMPDVSKYRPDVKFWMVFMPTISTFAIAELLTMNNIKLFGTTIQENINNSMWNYGAALSLIMLFLIGATTLLASDDKDHNEGGGLW